LELVSPLLSIDSGCRQAELQKYPRIFFLERCERIPLFYWEDQSHPFATFY
jgi:hypothetical protein